MSTKETYLYSRGGGGGGGGRGVLKKVLYGEAPPRGPTPYPFTCHFFFRKGTPFVYLLFEKGTPLIYLLMNKSLKQEVFLSFFRVARNKLK